MACHTRACQQPVLTGATQLWRLSWRHPVTFTAAVGAFVVGALGGTIPTGFLVLSSGAGFGRGATWGFWAFAAASPLLVVYTVAVLCSARHDCYVDRDLFLAGQTQAVTMARDGLAAMIVAVMLAGPAAAGGMIVGVADALARGTTVWTAFSLPSLLSALAAACWWSVLVIAIVALVRSAGATMLILTGFVATGLAAVQAASDQIAWDVLSASPFAPLAFVVRNAVAGHHGYETHLWLVAIGCLVWPAAAAWLAWRTQHRRLPKAPA